PCPFRTLPGMIHELRERAAAKSELSEVTSREGIRLCIPVRVGAQKLTRGGHLTPICSPDCWGRHQRQRPDTRAANRTRASDFHRREVGALLVGRSIEMRTNPYLILIIFFLAGSGIACELIPRDAFSPFVAVGTGVAQLDPQYP